MTDGIHFLDATELAARIRSGALTSVQVVQAQLDRITAIDPKINAIVTLNDKALVEAQAADDATRRRPGGRSAAWCAVHGEGLHRHRRHPHSARLADLPRPYPGRGCRRRGEDEASIHRWDGLMLVG